ncbi:hypothetical protein B0H19DRAFT_1194027 [Mycena capillaripes]|nr:hypothetical protein B0H19DRAFT_1194027 [Mycena capillaripes]
MPVLFHSLYQQCARTRPFLSLSSPVPSTSFVQDQLEKAGPSTRILIPLRSSASMIILPHRNLL